MSIELDHMIVPARDRRASAELVAALLGVPWAESGVGPLPVQHYCFRVSETEFDGILARISKRGIPCRSTPHGPVDNQVNTQHGGRIVYWSEPDGHVWEVLTVSYARRP